MRLRLKFIKIGRLKYIGHLDLLNIFNRAIKSAKLPVLYSKGFNPHMLVVFAAPLPLGITSRGEYVDIDFSDGQDGGEVVRRLNDRLPEGLTVIGSYSLGEPYKRAPSLVTRAMYTIRGITGVTPDRIASFMALEHVEIMKKTKRKSEMTDIKPDIFLVEKDEEVVSAVLSCGSRDNLKATLFAEAFCGFLNLPVPLYKLDIERVEIFGEDGISPLYANL